MSSDAFFKSVEDMFDTFMYVLLKTSSTKNVSQLKMIKASFDKLGLSTHQMKTFDVLLSVSQILNRYKISYDLFEIQQLIRQKSSGGLLELLKLIVIDMQKTLSSFNSLMGKDSWIGCIEDCCFLIEIFGVDQEEGGAFLMEAISKVYTESGNS